MFFSEENNKKTFSFGALRRYPAKARICKLART
jgi:hypothetical protein